VRQGLLLHPVDGALEGLLVGGGVDVAVSDVLDGTGEEAAGAAGGVEEGLAELGVDLLDHEAGDGAGGVELAGVAGALEVAEDLLVEVAEEVAVGALVEVDGPVDLVDHLAQEGAGLHVVVGVLEDGTHHRGAAIAVGGDEEVLQVAKELVVDEIEERLAGDPLGVGGPVAPAQRLGDGGGVVVVEELQLLLAVVEDLQEEHPDELADALGVAVDADVLAHDVLDGLDGGGDGHGVVRPRCSTQRRKDAKTPGTARNGPC